MPVTYAELKALEHDFILRPQVPLREGMRKLDEWYKEYYIGGINK